MAASCFFPFSAIALGIIDDLKHFSQRQSPQYKTLGRLFGSSNLEEQIAHLKQSKLD